MHNLLYTQSICADTSKVPVENNRLCLGRQLQGHGFGDGRVYSREQHAYGAGEVEGQTVHHRSSVEKRRVCIAHAITYLPSPRLSSILYLEILHFIQAQVCHISSGGVLPFVPNKSVSKETVILLIGPI